MWRILLVTATGVSRHFQQVITMISYGPRRKFGLRNSLTVTALRALATGDIPGAEAAFDCSDLYTTWFSMAKSTRQRG